MRRLSLFAAFLLLTAFSAVKGDDPRWSLDEEGYLTMSELPLVLDDPGIQDHLTSGLTTSFVVRTQERPRPRNRSGGSRSGDDTNGEGGARIDVRYELWEEVFQVLTVSTDGTLTRRALESTEALRQWWRGLEIRILKVGRASGGQGAASGTSRRAQATLDVVPFSRSEQLDAQRWLTEAAARSRSEGASRSPEKDEPTGGIGDLLMATSIGRRSLLTLRWRIDLDQLPAAADPSRRTPP